MKPKRIILVRHGQSEGNLDYVKYETIPDFALNLTEKGKEQSIHAGKVIANIIGDESIYAYVSPFYRSRQTFERIGSILGERILRSIEDPRIREMDFGHLRHPDEGKKINKLRDNYSTFYYRVEDGESGADVYDRVSTFLETMHRDFAKQDYPDNTLIVTHGLTLRLFLMRWFHWTVEEFEALRNPENCQVVIMGNTEKGKFQLTTNLAKR